MDRGKAFYRKISWSILFLEEDEQRWRQQEQEHGITPPQIQKPATTPPPAT
jgi:hypothetical protein